MTMRKFLIRVPTTDVYEVTADNLEAAMEAVWSGDVDPAYSGISGGEATGEEVESFDYVNPVAEVSHA